MKERGEGLCHRSARVLLILLLVSRNTSYLLHSPRNLTYLKEVVIIYVYIPLGTGLYQSKHVSESIRTVNLIVIQPNSAAPSNGTVIISLSLCPSLF